LNFLTVFYILWQTVKVIIHIASSTTFLFLASSASLFLLAAIKTSNCSAFLSLTTTRYGRAACRLCSLGFDGEHVVADLHNGNHLFLGWNKRLLRLGEVEFGVDKIHKSFAALLIIIDETGILQVIERHQYLIPFTFENFHSLLGCLNISSLFVLSSLSRVIRLLFVLSSLFSRSSLSRVIRLLLLFGDFLRLFLFHLGNLGSLSLLLLFEFPFSFSCSCSFITLRLCIPMILSQLCSSHLCCNSSSIFCSELGNDGSSSVSKSVIDFCCNRGLSSCLCSCFFSFSSRQSCSSSSRYLCFDLVLLFDCCALLGYFCLALDCHHLCSNQCSNFLPKMPGELSIGYYICLGKNCRIIFRIKSA